MSGMGDRFNQFIGKTRFMVCRILVHLSGADAAPLLGALNQAARNAVDADGSMRELGEGLVDVCQGLLERSSSWQSAANEGDVIWDEGEAGDYVTELFTDSAQRYLSSGDLGEGDPQAPLTLPVTRNLIVMIVIACEGEVPELETDLAEINALETALKALINLHYQDRYRAIQVHFSPAQLGDELTDEQVLLNFPELIPL